MKKIKILCLLFLLVSPLVLNAQVYIFDLGKPKGKAASGEKDGQTFVDAQAMTKKLGGDSTFLAQSKQIRIKINSFSAVIAAGRKDILLNGEPASLKQPAEITGSKIYVPIEFFTSPQLSAALGRQILYSDGKYELENFYNLEYLRHEKTDGAAFLFFRTKGKPSFKTAPQNKSVVEVEFADSVIKRQGVFKIKKDKLINNFTAKKCGANQCLRFLLNPAAKSWDFDYDGKLLVFKAFANAPAETSSRPASSAAAQEDDGDEDEGEVISSSAFFAAAGAAPAVASAAAKPAAAKAVPQQPAARSVKTKMRIVIDPGHGGKDPGAVRKLSSKEKEINLYIAKDLYDLLKKKGYDVKMTRTDDTFLALHERSKAANDFNADVFVSIHTNTAPRLSAQGFEVYFRSEKASDSQAAETAAFENEALQYEETHFSFADMLLRSLAVNEYINESSKLAGHVRNSVKATSGTGILINPNSSVKQANFYVLKGVDAPAILIECGYISNISDRKQLNNKAARAKIAEGIYKGILSYAKAEGWQ